MTYHVLKRGVSALGIGIAFAVAALAPQVYAQPQPYPQQQPQVQPVQPAPYGYARRDARSGERIDRRLAFLHQRLGISPAQEAAWTEFAGELRTSADAAERDRGVRGGERGPMSAVQRLELRERMLEKRSADLDRELHALRPLYASFSDAQKRVADELLVRAGQPGQQFRGQRERNREPRPGF
ncbi:MAG TPA: Spy/CpxP family protein refolding chaperone [Micropepsaceae bacterium]|nr:Spy/CpxP family protein refolding chaperone [Micropepsaceae bacterium]